MHSPVKLDFSISLDFTRSLATVRTRSRIAQKRSVFYFFCSLKQSAPSRFSSSKFFNINFK